MSPSVGIDISHYQTSIPAGDWLFIVHAAGDGINFVDPTFQQRFASTPGLRGAYHYARPLQSDGLTQAGKFCTQALAAGFKPGIDLWQLDCEAGENLGISPAQWRLFITNFMWHCYIVLGRRGFLYAGYPFLAGLGLLDLVDTFQWWLPDYGTNDGKTHPYFHALPHPPVIHQFTSNPIDQNVIDDLSRWIAILSPAPTPPSALAKLLAYLAALKLRPLHLGDKGPRVQQLNALLAKRFPGLVSALSEVYDIDTQVAIGAWKWNHHFSNLDDKVCGYPCFVSLLHG